MGDRGVDYQEIATQLFRAQTEGREVNKITVDYPELTVEDAYAIQAHVMALAERDGDSLVGWKMGLTSQAKQRSVGVHQPIFGRLTARMELVSNQVSMHGLIHPRLEPEIAFVLKKPLGGHRVTVRDVWAATECMMPAIEIIDSRYRDFSFTLVDVVADNASACQFYLSEQAFSPYDRLWDTTGVTMCQNGHLVQSGSAAAILGHPVRSVVQLTRMLALQEISLNAGAVILAGGITDAVPIAAGDVVQVRFDGLGDMVMAAGA